MIVKKFNTKHLNTYSFYYYLGIQEVSNEYVKMTKLEQIEFENKDKFLAAIGLVLDGKESSRTYEDRDGKPQKKKIINNNRLYVGNNFAIEARVGTNDKVYVAINYFSAEDRMNIAKAKKENESSSNEV